MKELPSAPPGPLDMSGVVQYLPVKDKHFTAPKEKAKGPSRKGEGKDGKPPAKSETGASSASSDVKAKVGGLKPAAMLLAAVKKRKDSGSA